MSIALTDEMTVIEMAMAIENLSNFEDVATRLHAYNEAKIPPEVISRLDQRAMKYARKFRELVDAGAIQPAP